MLGLSYLIIIAALFVGNSVALLQNSTTTRRGGRSVVTGELQNVDFESAPGLFFKDSTTCNEFWDGWEFSGTDECSALNNCASDNGIYLFSPNTELCTLVTSTGGSVVNFAYGDPTKFERLAFTVWETNLAAGQNCRVQFTKIDRGTAPEVCPANHQCVTCGDSSGIDWISIAVDSVWNN